jgi:hypothetical protein
MLIEVTEKKTIELALPFFSRESDFVFIGVLNDETLIRVCVMPGYMATVGSYAKDYMFFNSDIVAAYKHEHITATEFYYALDKAAQILIAQCQR